MEIGERQHAKRDHLDFGSCIPGVNEPEGEKCWHHAYYQFVVMVLVLQAACFYFPWYAIKIFIKLL